jgi:hypothetical protein
MMSALVTCSTATGNGYWVRAWTDSPPWDRPWLPRTRSATRSSSTCRRGSATRWCSHLTRGK